MADSSEFSRPHQNTHTGADVEASEGNSTSHLSTRSRSSSTYSEEHEEAGLAVASALEQRTGKAPSRNRKNVGFVSTTVGGTVEALGLPINRRVAETSKRKSYEQQQHHRSHMAAGVFGINDGSSISSSSGVSNDLRDLHLSLYSSSSCSFTSSSSSSSAAALSRASSSILSAGATLQSLQLQLKNLRREGNRAVTLRHTSAVMMCDHDVELHHLHQLEREEMQAVEDALRDNVVEALNANQAALEAAAAAREEAERTLLEELKVWKQRQAEALANREARERELEEQRQRRARENEECAANALLLQLQRRVAETTAAIQLTANESILSASPKEDPSVSQDKSTQAALPVAATTGEDNDMVDDCPSSKADLKDAVAQQRRLSPAPEAPVELGKQRNATMESQSVCSTETVTGSPLDTSTSVSASSASSTSIWSTASTAPRCCRCGPYSSQHCCVCVKARKRKCHVGSRRSRSPRSRHCTCPHHGGCSHCISRPVSCTCHCMCGLASSVPPAGCACCHCSCQNPSSSAAPSAPHYRVGGHSYPYPYSYPPQQHPTPHSFEQGGFPFHSFPSPPHPPVPFSSPPPPPATTTTIPFYGINEEPNNLKPPQVTSPVHQKGQKMASAAVREGSPPGAGEENGEPLTSSSSSSSSTSSCTTELIPSRTPTSSRHHANERASLPSSKEEASRPTSLVLHNDDGIAPVEDEQAPCSVHNSSHRQTTTLHSTSERGTGVSVSTNSAVHSNVTIPTGDAPAASAAAPTASPPPQRQRPHTHHQSPSATSPATRRSMPPFLPSGPVSSPEALRRCGSRQGRCCQFGRPSSPPSSSRTLTGNQTGGSYLPSHHVSAIVSTVARQNRLRPRAYYQRVGGHEPIDVTDTAYRRRKQQAEKCRRYSEKEDDGVEEEEYTHSLHTYGSRKTYQSRRCISCAPTQPSSRAASKIRSGSTTKKKKNGEQEDARRSPSPKNLREAEDRRRKVFQGVLSEVKKEQRYCNALYDDILHLVRGNPPVIVRA